MLQFGKKVEHEETQLFKASNEQEESVSWN